MALARHLHLLIAIGVALTTLITAASATRVLQAHADYPIHTDYNTMLRSLDRRKLASCFDPNPFLSISHDATGPLADRQNVTVTVSGVIQPSADDWIAVFSPSTSDTSNCLQNEILYLETGDVASLPLLCHYPIKFQYLKEDPAYMQCSNKACSMRFGRACVTRSCRGSLTFELINVRTDIKFVFFTGGFDSACVLAHSNPLPFANPNQPLYGHLSAVDSTGTAMKLTWVSGDSQPQTVQYAYGKSARSTVTTFRQSDMCIGFPGPASDFGWHDPGFIHSATLTGLLPSTSYPYKYGSDQVGWSPTQKLKTPPASGSSKVNFITFGDMGKAPRDNSIEHYIQPGSLGVIKAVSGEVAARNVDLVLHIGDISYATGFLGEWDQFLDLITPIASEVPYMTAIGNHERDFPDSGSYYVTPDSGGECGVAYEKYFQMPTQEQDKPWYSFEAGPVHFTVMSTEHDWTNGSEQYKWIQSDLASVDRKGTPWLVFTGHRPQYSSVNEEGVLSRISPSVDPAFPAAVEPLLLQGQVDLVLWGHVHNYERTCAVYQNQCLLFPSKDGNGIDTYQSSSYKAPVHAVIGMGGFSLDSFVTNPGNWSLSRISSYGYVKVDATAQDLQFQFIAAGGVQDAFKILKQ